MAEQGSACLVYASSEMRSSQNKAHLVSARESKHGQPEYQTELNTVMEEKTPQALS